MHAMLGDLCRESLEYEIPELPVWPETFIVQLEENK